jgi:hypothetical protein
MNYTEATATTQNAMRKYQQNSAFNTNWEASGKMIAQLAVPKDINGNDESFIENSNVFKSLIQQINVDTVSLPDLILLSQAAKAIETGDSKAAQFVRDSSGGKPVEKHEHTTNLAQLSDAQLAMLEENMVLLE